jgi:hypothetical protein
VLCILTDLNRTIKNEQLKSISTVLLSAFPPANTEDPDTSSYNQLPWNMLHDTIGLRRRPPPPPCWCVLEAQRACAQRGAACLPQRARDGSDVEEAQHPLPLSRRHPSALQSGLKKSDKLGHRRMRPARGAL